MLKGKLMMSKVFGAPSIRRAGFSTHSHPISSRGFSSGRKFSLFFVGGALLSGAVAALYFRTMKVEVTDRDRLSNTFDKINEKERALLSLDRMREKILEDIKELEEEVSSRIHP